MTTTLGELILYLRWQSGNIAELLCSGPIVDVRFVFRINLHVEQQFVTFPRAQNLAARLSAGQGPTPKAPGNARSR